MTKEATPMLDVCKLDVWGNDEDGYEVNCAYPSGVQLLPGMDDNYYYRQLRNFFPHMPAFRVTWHDENTADVDDAKTGKPFLSIQLA